MAESAADRYLANWRDEIDSAALYRVVADAERDDALARVYRRLAEVEEAHARFWEDKLREAGRPAPPRAIGWRTRALAWLARRFGPSFILPTLDEMERADRHSYDGQPETAGSRLPAEERSHARLLREIAGGAPPAAATACAPRCWAPTTGCSPTSAW